MKEKKWVEIKNFACDIRKNLLKSIEGICEINNVLYLVSAYGISTLNNELYKFSSSSYLGYIASCQVENNILVILEDFDVSDFLEYKLLDTKNGKISEGDIETGRRHFAVAHYLDQLWIVGGCSDKHGALKAIQTFDLVSGTLYFSPVEMIQARSDPKIIVYKNNLFVFGGSDEDTKSLSSVEMYSPKTNKFVLMTPMKIARFKFACCRVGNLVYVIGGRTVDYKTKSVEIYNLDTDTWTCGADFPIESSHLGGCVVSNILQ